MERITEVFSFVATNWSVIVAAICAIILAISKIIEFISLPTEKKILEVKKRLLTWVTSAELDLGGGTGEIKLAEVYDTFCIEYPYLKKWISLDKFEDMVDEALTTMRKNLSEDPKDNISIL